MQAVEPLIAVGRHHVLKSVHPSGLSANRVGCLPLGQVPHPRCYSTSCFMIMILIIPPLQMFKRMQLMIDIQGLAVIPT